MLLGTFSAIPPQKEKRIIHLFNSLRKYLNCKLLLDEYLYNCGHNCYKV